MNYPHYIRIRHPTGETDEDRDTGVITPVYDLVYEGPADVQDEGAVLSARVETSEEVRDSTATIFLPERAKAEIALVEPEDVVQFMWGRYPPADPDDPDAWEGDAEVVRAIRLDVKLLVKAV